MAAITFGIQDVPTKRAVAELQRQIDALKKENTALKGRVSELEKKVSRTA